MTKICSKCRKSLKLDEFHKNKAMKDGLNNVCKQCKSQYCKDNAEEYKRRNKAKYNTEKGRRMYRNCMYKSTFGITIEDYDKMYALQDGKCAICRKPETTVMNGKAINLSVDHDHSTGKVRGLLCRSCNHGIGNFLDNTELLHEAIKYIVRYGITE